jgi:Holliday junction resolvase RusA-like endonuclease
MFEETILFEPVSLKRHRHRMGGGTYDPSKKEKDAFIQLIHTFPEKKMNKPIKCILRFYCKRPKTHYKSGKNSNILKDNAPKYNTNKKDLDNMVKFVLDAFNNQLYEDDCQIIEIQCAKLYAEHSDETGYIYAKFEEIE